MSKLWIAITILGPVLLAAVMLWSMLRNRRQTHAQTDRTEQGTRDLYAKEDRIAQRDDAIDRTPIDPSPRP